jgi:hypothetical protein
MILQDLLDFIDRNDDFELEYDGHKVTFYDDYGISCGSNAEWFVAGHEFGASFLIHACSFEAAWEVWIDESPTIPESELTEAYGVPDSDEISTWREKNPVPPYHEREAWSAWFDAKHVEEKRILTAWDDASRARERDYPGLIEGYEYQSNSSGTGIVDVGHYAWMNEADLSKVVVTRKVKEGAAK